MDHRAHGLDLKHTIFNAPNKVDFAWETGEVESQYKGQTSVLYPDGMKAFRFTKFETEKGYWNPILVNHAGFFTDVPGLENLSEGCSAKILGSVSLVRQGRYFYWGYSIDPKRMTSAAKDTFANVLHYMHGKRHSLTVRFACKPRQLFETYLYLARKKDYKRGIEEHLPGSLTPESRKTYTDSSKAGCAKWLAEYLPYLISGKAPEHRGKRYRTTYSIDFDAHALGTPNAKRSSLETWMRLLGDDDAKRRELAARCLQRYVHPSIAPKAANWSGWYAKYEDRIVFIESTGFWWQEDPRILEREGADAVPRAAVVR